MTNNKLVPRLLRFPEVRARTGISRSTVWRRERAGDFPRHVRVSPNVVAWVESDIDAWIAARQTTGEKPKNDPVPARIGN